MMSVSLEEIIHDDTRVRVVRAAPGSGKTWLISEVVRAELKEWKSVSSGIAVLSFTNVAAHEVRKRLDYEPGHPHFVGTLDSFIYRYIVRPFAHLFEPSIRFPRLLAPDQVDHLSSSQNWSQLNTRCGEREFLNIFHAQFVGELSGRPVISARLRRWDPMRVLDPSLANRVYDAKAEVWRRSGRISISDANFIASRLISCSALSHRIRTVLTRRFPLILLDEAQDTGYFAGKIVLSLLSIPGVRALIVGDPDQAIYEFNGASPELFEDFEEVSGARVFPLRESRRCPEAICHVANQLTVTGELIRPRADAPKGRALLFVMDERMHNPREIATGLSEKSVLVTRWNSDVDRLEASRKVPEPKFSSRGFDLLHRAVNYHRANNSSRAYKAAEACLGRCLLGTEVPCETDFRNAHIDPAAWRKSVLALLAHAVTVIPDETLYGWADRIRSWIADLVASSDWTALEKLPRRPKKATADRTFRAKYLFPGTADEAASGVRCFTVHGVKGQTHHTTVLYVAEAVEGEGPAHLWWSDDATLREERRIAFVAATRPTDTFALCLHRPEFASLCEMRPQFISSFEVGEAA